MHWLYVILGFVYSLGAVASMIYSIINATAPFCLLFINKFYPK